MAKADIKVASTSERNPSARDPEKRSYQFTSVLGAAVLVVPALGVLCRFIVFWAPEILWLVAGLALAMGFILAAAAVGVGFKVAKRIEFVVWHAALTAMLFGVAVYVTTTVRWPERSEAWWVRLLAVVNWPAWWVVLHLFASLAIAGSWLLYRIDAFRASTGEAKDDGGIAKLVNWPKFAKVREETIEADDFAVTAEVDHEGVPIAQLRASLPAIEEHRGFVRGAATIVGDDKGGKSTVRFVHTDPMTEWREWPGLSHPGGYYHDPIRTSYYTNGQQQWYSFVKTPDGYRSKRVPDFASPNGSFKGAQGMTGAGKSGDAAIECAEVLSRQRVVLVYVDPAKLMQNAAWCLDQCGLAAGSRDTSGALFAALERMGVYRERVLSHHGVRDFDQRAAEKTGLSWIHIFADEFDVAKQGSAMNWLATKGRSLGFRFSFTLPRATGENLDTNIRAAVGMWAQFGISQDYDDTFVLSKETRQAGADAERWGAAFPGAHYLDHAPGVDKKLWAHDCRSYKTREDFSDLRERVLAARSLPGFVAGELTPGEIEALGDVYEICSPQRVRASRSIDPAAQSATPTPAPATPPAPAVTPTPADGQEEDDDVSKLLGLDPETRAMLESLPSTDVSDLEAEYGKLDPRAPLPDALPDTFTMPSAKRVASAEETRAEANAALIRMAQRGVQEFGNSDLRDEMRVAMRANTMSAWLTQLDQDHDGMVSPPGLKIRRLSAGRYVLVRLGEH